MPKYDNHFLTLSTYKALREDQTVQSVAAVRRSMKLLRFTEKKPLYQAWQQDAAPVRQWETDTSPAIRAEAQATGATIYFADESRTRSDYHTGTTWASKGQTPVVEATGRRFGLNLLSAVSPRGAFRFLLHESSDPYPVGLRRRTLAFRQRSSGCRLRRA